MQVQVSGGKTSGDTLVAHDEPTVFGCDAGIRAMIDRKPGSIYLPLGRADRRNLIPLLVLEIRSPLWYEAC